MKVKIERYFKYPDLKRQTPNNSMNWKEFVFTEDDIEECDYLVILEYPSNDFSIKVNKNNIIHLCLEPPNEISKYRQYANKSVKYNYNQLDTKNGNILSHGALPWHIGKDYDYLSHLKVEDLKKENKIVWVTSNQRSSKGHSNRMHFLDSIKNLSFIELYGRGIKPIDDKWDVLSNSKYAIAYENYKSEYYWTEKIIDCYLSFTMPIYFGCNRIDNYFPKDSYIKLDPNDKHIDLFLKELVNSNKWEKNIDSIQEARELILSEYQLFPFLYNKIKSLESINGKYMTQKKEMVSILGGDKYFNNYPKNVLLEKKILKIKNKLKI
ncbi:glycosyltransferase family 10 domain-containing protein [Polaribacter sargassicola]|uniref:glycosyltransferase family 10 domain-containing protein n=1 Tax=Polaribacter sargassicola TaxID=2836891 RepID=UPI001EFFE4A0|nr:glycosyltransferase family 10 [Polaribacter sp. DS7-9]MCG1036608.1 hypothetical protein [Polaribacter sp. DS7-9]